MGKLHELLAAVKQARMRANSVEQVEGSAAGQITALFAKVFS